MRKLFFILCLLMFSTTAFAQHRHFHPHHHRHWIAPPIHHWVVPAIVGGAVVYAATRPDPVIVQQPLQSNHVVIDGIVYVKQVMIINGVQQEVLVKQ